MLPAYCRCRHGVQSCVVIMLYAVAIIACVNWLGALVQSAAHGQHETAAAAVADGGSDKGPAHGTEGGDKAAPPAKVADTGASAILRAGTPTTGVAPGTDKRMPYRHTNEHGGDDEATRGHYDHTSTGAPSPPAHLLDIHKRSVLPAKYPNANQRPPPGAMENLKEAREIKQATGGNVQGQLKPIMLSNQKSIEQQIRERKQQLAKENEQRLAEEKERRRKERAPPNRIVHFDLKGAPPKADYLVKLMPLLKELGATGVLIEWEDTFPYTGQLADAVAGYAYTPTDVDRILSAARNASLDIVPLVQTFGHLEWVLKLAKFAHLRDNPDFPQVICAAHPEAWQLLTDMLQQVISVHQKYGLRHVHIGADEVFQYGTCKEAKEEIVRQQGREKFMLWHIARTAKLVKEKAPESKVMIWHDMIASLPAVLVKDTGLHELVEPVVWMYAENIDQYLPSTTWDNLKPFSYVWGASAYKGADGPMRYHSRTVHYARNTVSWMRQYANHRRQFTEFRGIILTGWSRYDHFAVLCELLPVALPSLFMSLTLLTMGEENVNYQFAHLKELFSCHMSAMNGAAGDCTFPGARIHHRVQELRNTRDEMARTIWSDFDPGFEYNGWMGRMNQEYTFSSAWYVDKLMPQIKSYAQRLTNVYRDLERELSAIYDESTVGEFLHEYVFPDLRRLLVARRAANEIRQTRTFDVRPLKGTETLRATMERFMADN